MKKLLKDYMQYNQNVIAFCVTSIAMLLLIGIFMKNPRPSLLDTGQYDLLLQEFGLSRSESLYSSDEYYTKANEQFQIETTPWKELLLIKPTRSLVYPIRIICFICSFLQLPFSTVYLTMLLAVMLLSAIYIFIKSLYVHIKGFSAVVGGMLCFIIFCGNYVIPMNSLYSKGMFLVSLFGFAAAVLRGSALLKNDTISKKSILLPIAITALLLLNSMETMVVIYPFVIGICIYYTIKCSKKSHCSIKYYICSILMVLGITYSCFSFYMNSSLLFSKVNLYQTVFDGVLVHSQDPEQALASFGLEEEFIQDIGKTAFYPETEYYIAPLDEENNAKIYDHLSYWKVGKYYSSHISELMETAKEALVATAKIDYNQFIYTNDNLKDGHKEQVVRNEWWNLLRDLLYSSHKFYVILCLFMGVIGVFFFFCNSRKLAYAFWILTVSDFALLLLIIFAAGDTGFTEYSYSFQVLADVMLVMILTTSCVAVNKAYQFIFYSKLSERKQEPSSFVAEAYVPLLEENYLKSKKKKVSQFFDLVSKNRKVFVGCATVVCGLIMFIVMFLPRIGAYNNGDFGRIMDAMNLTYVPEDYYNPSEQYTTKVIERYNYIEPYDWSGIRPSKLRLSQTYVSAIMRIAYQLTGIGFSTAIVAGFYLILVLLSFSVIMKTAYQWLGKYAGVLAVIFIVMFCGSDNLGWLNSLFGEGVGFVGLMLVIASSLSLLEKKKGDKGVLLRFVLLGGSSIFLTCGKSQYTVLCPILIIWLLILVVHYMPSKLRQRFLVCAATSLWLVMISTAAFSVYRQDSKISSQDTLYQGLCNGILVVAEDPEQALSELGLDSSLVQDAGKNAYLPDEEYYCVPRSELAEKLIYSKVSTLDYLLWYITHPSSFYKMLNVAAKASEADMPDYNLYVGEKTTEDHRTVSKLNLWKEVRPYVTPSYFLGYVFSFGILVLYCFVKMKSKKTDGKSKLYYMMFLIIMAVGVFEFPLTVIGNGYSDNIKQLYLFRVVFDIMILVVIGWVIDYLRKREGRHEGKEDMV